MSENEGHLHHAQLANLAAMARSIFHQVGATKVAQPELTTLVSFNGADGGNSNPWGSLSADAHGDLFGSTNAGGANGLRQHPTANMAPSINVALDESSTCACTPGREDSRCQRGMA